MLRKFVRKISTTVKKDMLKRGALIVVEGIDKSGKSTQCDLLAKKLRSLGHKTKLMKFPNRSTVIGQLINSYLQNENDLDDQVIHLLFSANRWEANYSMNKDLLSGITLIVDRYAFSGVAYSAAKPGMDINWCKMPDRGLLKPDMVMFLNLSAEEAQRRSGFGDDRYETIDFQKSVFANYEKLSSEYWTFIDAGDSLDNVNKEMTKIAEKVIKNVKGTEIGKLWVDEDYKENLPC